MMCANQVQRPVILITSSFGPLDLAGYLGSINQEVVYFIDEYDKIFEDSNQLLSIMDGIFNSKFKKLFLLTKNDGMISRFMIDRPGRIRYIKEYGNLSVETIQEIVEDLLVNKQHTEELVDRLATIEIITVDIVRSIIVEMNIHNFTPTEAFTYFNVTVKNPYIDVFEIIDGKEVELFRKVSFYNRTTLETMHKLKNNNFVITTEDNHETLGRVEKIEGNRITTMQNVDMSDFWATKEDGEEFLDKEAYEKAVAEAPRRNFIVRTHRSFIYTAYTPYTV